MRLAEAAFHFAPSLNIVTKQQLSCIFIQNCLSGPTSTTAPPEITYTQFSRAFCTCGGGVRYRRRFWQLQYARSSFASRALTHRPATTGTTAYCAVRGRASVEAQMSLGQSTSGYSAKEIHGLAEVTPGSMIKYLFHRMYNSPAVRKKGDVLSSSICNGNLK